MKIDKETRQFLEKNGFQRKSIGQWTFWWEITDPVFGDLEYADWKADINYFRWIYEYDRKERPFSFIFPIYTHVQEDLPRVKSEMARIMAGKCLLVKEEIDALEKEGFVRGRTFCHFMAETPCWGKEEEGVLATDAWFYKGWHIDGMRYMVGNEESFSCIRDMLYFYHLDIELGGFECECFRELKKEMEKQQQSSL